MGFSFEMCILPKESSFTWMKISGKLPRLHLNLSDKKYKALMKTLDLISYSFSSSAEEVDTKHPKALMPDNPPPVVAAEEWDFSPTQEFFMADEFHDAEEDIDSTNDDETVYNQKTTSQSQELIKMSRVLIEFSFQVGEFSVSLQKSNANGLQDTTLADLTIADFYLKYVSRPFDSRVDIQIASAQIKDNLQQADAKFQYLLSKSFVEGNKENPKFITIAYESTKKESPEFKGVDQNVDIAFGAVDIVLTISSILSLYDFVLTTFTTSEKSAQTVIASGTPVEVAKKQPDRTFTIALSSKSIRLLLNKDGIHLATASFDDGLLAIVLKSQTMQVHGRLGNLLVLDHLARNIHTELHRQFLSIEGGEAADFVFETFNKAASDYPGYDSALTLKAPSLRMTHLEDFTRQLQQYFSEFQKLHILLETARKAAVESANQIQSTAGRFHIDIDIQTPIIVFPEASLALQDNMTMYLGRITASNAFREEDGSMYQCASTVVTDVITARVSSMKLVSNLSNDEGTLRPLDILQDVNVDFTMSRFNINLEQLQKNRLSVPDTFVSLLPT